LRAAVLTISDRCARGEREDRSGPLAAKLLQALGVRIEALEVLPDDLELLRRRLEELSQRVELIVTTGGTGLGPRDVTPEATRAVIEREIPGMAEAMRLEGLRRTPHAMLSRGLVGARGRCLIVNLPGSPGAVHDGLSAILDAIPHVLELIRGEQPH